MPKLALNMSHIAFFCRQYTLTIIDEKICTNKSTMKTPIEVGV